MSGWLETLTGVSFRLPEMEGDIRLRDIAHGLANQCRFNGQCKNFYSVAEHSIHVSRLVPEEMAMSALMHDATEAYMGDLISPLKDECPEFRVMEDRLWLRIADEFHLHHELPPEVKRADIYMLLNEAKTLMFSQGRDWGPYMGDVDPDEVPEVQIQCLAPIDARREFINRFAELKSRIAA